MILNIKKQKYVKNRKLYIINYYRNSINSNLPILFLGI